MSDGGHRVRCGHCGRRVRRSKTYDCGRCGAPIAGTMPGHDTCGNKCKRIRHAAGYIIGKLFPIMKGRIGKSL